MAIDPAELIASDVALDIYLSGWASGAKSAFLNWSDASDEEAHRTVKAALDIFAGDPIAREQLRQVLADIVHDTRVGPGGIMAYGPRGD